MANKTKFSWTHDGKNTDGSAMTADQFAGWLLEVNGQPTLSVPRGWEADGAYEVPFAEMGLFQETGDYTIRLAVVNKTGNASAFSSPATFSQDFRTPAAPKAVAVS